VNEQSGIRKADTRDSLSQKIETKVSLKLKAQRYPAKSVWLGLGMMGLIGWSVVVPTLIGAAMGHWVDKHHPGTHSWTLALLVAGLIAGCFNAWHWVIQEDQAMREDDHE